MSRTTIYKCDRCGKEHTNQFTSPISLVVNRGYGDEDMHKADWCRPCLEEVGIVPRPKPKKDEPTIQSSQPSLEEMIREIVRTEIQQ